MSDVNREVTMEKIVALAKNRGFVYPGSEIYGGLANTWDYGPLGAELKKNVKNAWWRKFVQESKYNVGLDAAILMNPQTWVASGHVGGFSDPLVDCKACKSRFRADKLIEDFHAANGMPEIVVDGWSNEELENYIAAHHIPCPDCGKTDFTGIRQFNLMFKTFQGVTEDSKSELYLRPETAHVSFLIALTESFFLSLETLALVDRIVKLRVSITHLSACDEQLETLNIIGSVRLFLGKGRDLNRVIHNKCRLNEVFLNKSLKEQVEDIAALVTLLKLNVVSLGSLSCFFKSLYLIEVNTRILLYSVDHGESFKGLAEIYHVFAIGNAGSSADFLCNMAVHIFCEIHHSVVVGVSLIKLHERKFRIVTSINAFISENSAYLVNSFKSAYDESLEVEFKADTELNVLVKGVVVSLKRSRSSSTRI